MMPPDQVAWRRAMGEAAALPADDSQRLRMQAEIAGLGPWAEAEWLALLEEGERWRLELGRVTQPDGLEDRLLRIAEGPRGIGLPRILGTRRLAWMAAAALLVAVSAWFALGGARAPEDGRHPANLQAIALLAMNDHLDTHTLEVKGEVPGEVASGLRDRIPFEIEFPEFEGGLRLEGGRRCTLGSHPVCFSTWRKGDVRFTLIQLRLADFDLPPGLPRTIVTPKGAAAGRRPLDVLVWSKGEFGWALVGDDSSALVAIRPWGR